MSVSASPSLNVTAAAHSVVAVLSQPEHVGREAGRVPEGAGCWSSGYQRGGRGEAAQLRLALVPSSIIGFRCFQKLLPLPSKFSEGQGEGALMVSTLGALSSEASQAQG